MKEESIDFKAITARVVTELGNMPLARKWRSFFDNYVEKTDVTPDWIRKQILEKVWSSCMEVLNKAGADAEPLLAEKALSELMKKDVVREKVVYKKNSFRLRLDNGRYRVYKNGPHGATFACPWPAEKRYEVHISGHREQATDGSGVEGTGADVPYRAVCQAAGTVGPVRYRRR